MGSRGTPFIYPAVGKQHRRLSLVYCIIYTLLPLSFFLLLCHSTAHTQYMCTHSFSAFVSLYVVVNYTRTQTLFESHGPDSETKRGVGKSYIRARSQGFNFAFQYPVSVLCPVLQQSYSKQINKKAVDNGVVLRLQLQLYNENAAIQEDRNSFSHNIIH